MKKLDGMASPMEPGEEMGGKARKGKRGSKRKRGRGGRKHGRY